MALKFLHDHAQGKRVLFVSPANAIKDSFMEKYHQWVGEDYCKLDTCLYQGLKGKQNKHYDIIIFDEVHRMGAKTWGPNAEALMNNNPNASILGMTATLDRPDCVDVRKYFDNREPVSRISLIEAFDRGLPKPDYVLAKIDFEDDVEYIDTCIKDFKEKLKQAEGEEKKQILEFLERLKKAKQAISESKDIPEIVASKLNTKELKQGKFIVFCPAGEDEDENKESIHRMKTIMKQAPKWFEGVEGIKKIKKYSVYSKLDARKNKQIIENFQNDKSKSLKLLFSINMLNEGLHVEGINGAIMLRSTSSRTVYLQQLGRALSIDEKRTTQPLVFDFVDNLNYVDVTNIQQIVDEVNKNNNEGGLGGGNVDNVENDLRFKLNVDNLDTLQLIDTLKSNIFAFNHQNDFEFEDFYNRLLEYKNEFGDCAVPQGYNCRDGYPLGKKTNSIRSGNIRINREEKQILIDIGFVWIATGVDVDNVRVGLKKFVEKFNAFVSKYGREPKQIKNPQNQEEEYEKNLSKSWGKYRQAKNLNKDEQDYLKANGIEVVEEYTDTVRKAIKDFVEKFNAFVSKYGRTPKVIKNPQNQEERDEVNLYRLWALYRQAKNLNKDEQDYLKANGIEVVEEYTDTVRKAIKDFVEKFNAFVSKYGRTPKSIKTCHEEIEGKLYESWLRYRQAKNLKNANEIRYLQEHGIEVIGLEEIQETETKPSGENFGQ